MEINISDAKDEINKQFNTLIEVIAILAKNDMESIIKDVENLENVIKQHYKSK